jgi:hypothetical protein
MLQFLAAAVAAQSLGLATPDDLSRLFVSACLDGSVRISPGDATAIQFRDLPAALRHRLGKPTDAKVWKFRSSDRSYLYLLDFNGRSDTRVCGVAGEALALTSGTAAMHARLRGGQTVTSAKESTEWFYPNAYKALATRTGGFTVLQVNWLNEQQAKVPQTQ